MLTGMPLACRRSMRSLLGARSVRGSLRSPLTIRRHSRRSCRPFAGRASLCRALARVAREDAAHQSEAIPCSRLPPVAEPSLISAREDAAHHQAPPPPVGASEHETGDDPRHRGRTPPARRPTTSHRSNRSRTAGRTRRGPETTRDSSAVFIIETVISSGYESRTLPA